MRYPPSAALALLCALAVAPPTASAAPAPGLFLDFGSAAHPAVYDSVGWRDTAGVRLFVEFGGVQSKVEGMEFYVAYDCSVDAACHANRSVDVLSFQPDTGLIGAATQQLCDALCFCDQCDAKSHWRLRIRTDRLSTQTPDFKGFIGTLHLRTTAPMRPARLHFERALLWVFGATPLEVRPLDVSVTNTARIGGVTAGGLTGWGTLRKIYR